MAAADTIRWHSSLLYMQVVYQPDLHVQPKRIEKSIGGHVMRTSGDILSKAVQIMYICVSFLAGFLVVQHPVSAESRGANVIFILDGSGSMWGRLDNVEKIVIAKDRMTELVHELDDVNMGLIVYGHRRKGDCDDIEMMVQLGDGNQNAVIQQIQSINPKGKTPIQRSIALAAQHLESLEEETEIVLVSDGLETCDDDPCGYVQNLEDKGIKFTLDVVGFDVSDKEREQLECLAQAGSGRYFAAENTMQLKEAFTEVKKEVVEKVMEMPKNSVIGTISNLITNTIDTEHNVQCWKVEPPYAKPGRWELSIQHAAKGSQGAFYLTAWTDTNSDGFPDQELGRSELMVAEQSGDWSSWEFTATSNSIFAGNCWTQHNERVFYQMGDPAPDGYTGLGYINYYSRQFDGTPNAKATPRYTNIRLRYIRQ